jgi:hypothetical protein
MWQPKVKVKLDASSAFEYTFEELTSIVAGMVGS